jgi:hypothetical protein
MNAFEMRSLSLVVEVRLGNERGIEDIINYNLHDEALQIHAAKDVEKVLRDKMKTRRQQKINKLENNRHLF